MLLVHSCLFARNVRSELAGCDPRVHYVDCGTSMLLTASGKINATLLMPDGISPTPAGFGE